MNILPYLISTCLDFALEFFKDLLAFTFRLAYIFLFLYSAFLFVIAVCVITDFVTHLDTKCVFQLARFVSQLVTKYVFQPLTRLTQPCWLSMIYQTFIGFYNFLAGLLSNLILSCFEVLQSCKIVSPQTKLNAMEKMKAVSKWVMSFLCLLPRKAIFTICVISYFLRHDSISEFKFNTFVLTVKVLFFLTIWNAVTSIRFTLWRSRLHLVVFVACNVIFVFFYSHFPLDLATKVYHIRPSSAFELEWLYRIRPSWTFEIEWIYRIRPYFSFEYEALYLIAGGPLLLLSLALFPSIMNNCFSLDMSLFLLGCLSPCIFTMIHVLERSWDEWNCQGLCLFAYPHYKGFLWESHLGRHEILTLLSPHWNVLCFVLFFSFSFRFVTWNASDSKPTSYAWIFELFHAAQKKENDKHPANKIKHSRCGLAVSLKGFFLFQLLLLVIFAEKHAIARAFITLEVLIWLVFVQSSNLHVFRAVSETKK